jgi:hypothetical protein
MIVTAFEMWAWEITGWGHIFAIMVNITPMRTL